MFRKMFVNITVPLPSVMVLVEKSRAAKMKTCILIQRRWSFPARQQTLYFTDTHSHSTGDETEPTTPSWLTALI